MQDPLSNDSPGERRARARLGITLNGKWHLDSLLGVGGMAAVYAATHRNGKRVAIKMLHRELKDHPEFFARFTREGYVANKVGHPGALSVIDDDIAEDGSAYMVMDLLEGCSLEQLRVHRGGTLPLDETLSIIDAVLDVLVAAHAHGIVHRDLKPDNIFVLHDGQIRVLDFGIARLREQAQEAKVTLSGAVMGTPGFMAPEQARGLWDLVDAQTDIWAVGATAYTLLSGKFLHEGRTVNEGLLLAMTQPVPELRTLIPGIPTPVGAWLDRALAFDKDARWSDAATMRREGREARRFPSSMALSGGPSTSAAQTQTGADDISEQHALHTATATIADSKKKGPRIALVAIPMLLALFALVGIATFTLRSRPAPNESAQKEPAQKEPASALRSVAAATPDPIAIPPLPASVTPPAALSLQPVPSSSQAAPSVPRRQETGGSGDTKEPAPKHGAASKTLSSASAPSASAAPSRPFDPLGRRK